MTYQLRHYQRAAFDQTFAMMARGATSILEVAPTGAGKTVLAAALMERLMQAGARVLFLAHRDELISQCCAKLDENGLAFGVIKANHDPRDLGARIHVAGIQTFLSRIRFMSRHYDLIVIDEAHHAPADSYKRIVAHCTVERPPLRIGLTATPYRVDGKGLGQMFDEMIEVASVQELIGQGFLVPPRVFKADMEPDTRGVRIGKDGDYEKGELSERARRPVLLGHAVQEYLRNAAGLRCMGFCVNKAHARAVCEAYLAAGIPAEYVDDSTPTETRRGVLRRFHDGQTLVVLNCGVFTEGFDEPRLMVVQALAPTKSLGRFLQVLGRGARPCPEIGKEFFIFLDHAGWTRQHGRFEDPHAVSLADGLKREQAEKLTTCKSCGAQFATRPTVCPDCGAPMASSATEDTIGLGDASVTLQEDAPFFGDFRERREAVTAYVPGRPNQFRVARRARGL